MEKDEIDEHSLTDGALLKLLDGQYTNDDLFLQVLEMRCIHEDLIFRLRLSDGVFSTSFSFIDGELLDDLHITEHSIIHLTQYQIRQISKDFDTRNVIHIEDAKVVAHPKTLVGDPENIDEDLGPCISVTDNNKPAVKCEPTQSLSQSVNNLQNKNKPKVLKPDVPPFEGKLTKISCLGESVKTWFGWILKVRVVNKLPLKTIYGGKGKMMVFHLQDDSGVLNAVAFDSDCDKFSAFQINHVYWLSGGIIRLFRDPKLMFHKYELKLEKATTKVRECVSQEDAEIPALEFNFTPLTAVKNVNSNATHIDVIGVCSRAMPVTSDANGNCHRKIMLIAPETDMYEIDLDLWGRNAEEFDDSQHPVVVVKNCRCSKFTNSTLFMDTISVFLVNPPNIAEVAALKEWYAEKCKDTNFNPQLMPTALEVETESFVEARKKVLTSKIKIVHVKCIATVIDTDPQYLVNLHCSACRNQVFDMNMEKLVCLKCGFVDGAIMRNLMTKIRIGDKASSEWVSVLDSECRKLLSISSSLIESHNTQVWQTLRNLIGQQFHVHLKFDRSREAKAPCQIVSMEPIPESIYF